MYFISTISNLLCPVVQDRKLVRDGTLQQLGDWNHPLDTAHEVRLQQSNSPRWQCGTYSIACLLALLPARQPQHCTSCRRAATCTHRAVLSTSCHTI